MATVTSTLDDYPFFMQKQNGAEDPIYYDADEFRLYTQALHRRTGILGSSHFLVTQSGTVGWSVKVNSGDANVGEGRYIVHSGVDTTLSLTSFDTTPAATRTHKIYLAVYDALLNGTEYAAKLVAVEDTGAGAGTPGGATAYLQLATVTISPGQSNIQNSHITNTVRHGGSAGEYVYLADYLNDSYVSAGNAAGTADLRARYEGGIVRLSGALGNTLVHTNLTNWLPGTNHDIGNMHSNLLPAHTRHLIGATNTTATFRLRIHANGTMTVSIPSDANPLYLFLDGMTYDLD